MNQDDAVKRAVADLAQAQRDHQAAPWDARPAQLTKVREAQHRLDGARTDRREAREREGVALARGADAATAGAALSTLVEARRAMPTPLAQAAFDDNHARQLGALEDRIEQLDPPGAGSRLVPNAEREAAVKLHDRAVFNGLAGNRVAQAAFAERRPWVLGGAQ